jgi:hypothetical protein
MNRRVWDHAGKAYWETGVAIEMRIAIDHEAQNVICSEPGNGWGIAPWLGSMYVYGWTGAFHIGRQARVDQIGYRAPERSDNPSFVSRCIQVVVKNAELILRETISTGPGAAKKRLDFKVAQSRNLDEPIFNTVQSIAFLQNLLIDECEQTRIDVRRR